MQNKVVVLKADDWEMLYVNGELKEEGHTLGDGYERVIYFLDMSENYNFDLRDIQWKYMEETDAKTLSVYGCANRYLNEYQGEYE